MSKIEVGMLVRMSDETFYYSRGIKIPSPNRGEIGTVLSYFGVKKAIESDEMLEYWITTFSTVRVAGRVLTPIPPDEPADEDFQEDLKRWLNKKVTA